jgi:hypothetical protein
MPQWQYIKINVHVWFHQEAKIKVRFTGEGSGGSLVSVVTASDWRGWTNEPAKKEDMSFLDWESTPPAIEWVLGG